MAPGGCRAAFRAVFAVARHLMLAHNGRHSGFFMKPRVAIIGSGIAGLGCAYALRGSAELVLFEKDDHYGGHAHAVEVVDPGSGARHVVDTGFMVLRAETYPRFSGLLRELGVPTQRTPVSIAIINEVSGLTYALPGLREMFSHRANVASPRFWRLARRIRQFHRDIARDLELPEARQWTLLDYVIRNRYGEDFINRYLIPMSTAIWNIPPEQMLLFPASLFIRFFHNYGLHDARCGWVTLAGGASGYVRRLMEACAFTPANLRGAATRVVRSSGGGASVYTADGAAEHFDAVVLATHADRALKLLHGPTPAEVRLLGPFKYRDTIATLHHDEARLPQDRKCWATWNYALRGGDDGRVLTATHYWMNRLQSLRSERQFFVTLGDASAINPDKILRRFSYRHPLFTRDALMVQPELGALNRQQQGAQSVYFSGSYFGHGFHEDALKSGEAAAAAILAGWQVAPK